MVMLTKTRESITLSPKILNKGGFVILTLAEYNNLQENNIPTYYLSGKKAQQLDQLVQSGLEAVKRNKTKKIKSLTDLD